MLCFKYIESESEHILTPQAIHRQIDLTQKRKLALRGLYYFAERRRSTPAPKEEEKVNEEQWPLREVVFVEDVKNVPVGKVGTSSKLCHCERILSSCSKMVCPWSVLMSLPCSCRVPGTESGRRICCC